MNLELKNEFLQKWRKYFGEKAELPITFWYSKNRVQKEEIAPKAWMCLMGQLGKVRKGQNLSFSAESISCGGGKAYCGFAPIIPGLPEFLSTGKERYLKTPELAKKAIDQFPVFKAPEKYITFKRWDELTEEDEPEVVFFFATPDVLSGLFTLANYDQSNPFGNMAPFSSGCGSIITYPYQEKEKENPKAFIGMFDPSARPFVPENSLSFAVPMKKFETMIANMDESFLTTPDWDKVKKRMERA
ncbi:MAG: DUF169 domain-containing protein [Marinifilaceae bacterium]